MDTHTTTYASANRRLNELHNTLAELIGIRIPMAARYEVLDAVAAERTRQHARHGRHAAGSPDLSDHDHFVILAEEVGEVARALTYDHSNSDSHPDALRTELVQVAAVALGWLDALPAPSAAPELPS